MSEDRKYTRWKDIDRAEDAAYSSLGKDAADDAKHLRERDRFSGAAASLIDGRDNDEAEDRRFRESMERRRRLGKDEIKKALERGERKKNE